MRRVRQEKGLSPSVYNDKLLLAIAVGLFCFGIVMLVVYGMPFVRYLFIAAVFVSAFIKHDELRSLYRQLKK